MSILFYTPFDKYPHSFTLAKLDISFKLRTYFNLDLFLFGFGFSLWWYPDTESDEYEILCIEPELYKSLFELTKYNGMMDVKDFAQISNDYNELYLFNNSGSFILKPKIK